MESTVCCAVCENRCWKVSVWPTSAGELVLRRGGDHMFEPLALRGDGVDGLLRGLGELLLEGVGMADEGGQRLLRGQPTVCFEMIDILAEGLLDAAGLRRPAARRWRR